ncbi:hypothetical protein B0H13DRAFT_1877856 [Mycena leptocephala]|nr:hypothetical protein B0H13DRAFT_1877856 [Mycena leptocephala]
MLTLSNLATLLVCSVLAANAAPGVQPAPNLVFAVYPGWDMDNGGNSTSGGTEMACQKSCSTSPSCAAYAYVPYGGGGGPPGTSCFLKNAVDISTFKTRAWDTTLHTAWPHQLLQRQCTRVIGAARTNTERTGIRLVQLCYYVIVAYSGGDIPFDECSD